MRLSLILLIAFIYLLPEIANCQSFTLKELTLIKVVIPEKFKTDYDLVLKAANVYDQTMNSKTAKALDSALNNFLIKVDATTASLIKEWRKNEKTETLGSLIEERDSYGFWNSNVKKNIDAYYHYIKHRNDDDEDGFSGNLEPVDLKYGEKSIHLLGLDKKILLAKIKYWNLQPENFKELYEVEKEIALTHQKIETALTRWNNLKKADNPFNDEESDASKKAKEEYKEQVAKKVELEKRKRVLHAALSVSDNTKYHDMKELLNNKIFKDIPEELLSLRF